SLAAGLPIERAVTDGRIGAYNQDKSGRDWGVPVLYMRAGDGRLFEGAADKAARDRARESADGKFRVRIGEVKGGAVVLGAELARMLGGRLAVNVTIPGTVLGELVGARFERVERGSLDAVVDINEVGPGGKVTGIVIGDFGTPPSRRTRGANGTEPAHSEVVDDEPPETAGTVNVGDNKGQAIGTQINYNYIQGPPPAVYPAAYLIEETIRLDVAVPTAATVDEPFPVVIAVSQPEAPPLSERDLPQVVSATGSVFRDEADSVVSYRIELAGDGFRVEPKQYKVKLRPRQNSVPVAFQVTSSKTGVRTLIVTALQPDYSVAAQTRLSIEVRVAVSGVS